MNGIKKKVFEGQVALVTGAQQGIGKAIRELLEKKNFI